MIELTPSAKEQISAALVQQEGKTILRVEAQTKNASEFAYQMKLISEDEVTKEDTVVDHGSVKIAVAPDSAQNLRGATIDYEDHLVKSGFKFDNPNKPETPELGVGPRADLTGPVAEKIQRLFDTELNPAVASHGGEINFHGVQDSKVYLSFGGGCHGCGMVDVTLKEGVEQRIRELIPEVEEIIDTTDHTTGENPFYT